MMYREIKDSISYNLQMYFAHYYSHHHNVHLFSPLLTSLGGDCSDGDIDEVDEDGNCDGGCDEINDCEYDDDDHDIGDDNLIVSLDH